MLRLRIKFVAEAAAVDVEVEENIENGISRNAGIDGPEENVEILFARFEAVENAVEQCRVIDKTFFEKSEVAAVKLDPKALALEVLQPASPQIAPPMLLHPDADRRLSQIAAGLFAFDPLVAKGFLLALDVDATFFHRPHPQPFLSSGGGCALALLKLWRKISKNILAFC